MEEEYMRRALELAQKGIGKTSPNPMVGAVLVKDGRIIGEGWHEAYGQAHAEVNAVRSAEEFLMRSGQSALDDLAGATMYVNLEPCCHQGKTPPCTELLIRKRVGRVVIGTLDPNPLVAGKGSEQLRRAGIQVEEGILEKDCRRLNEVFFHFIRTRRPFVILKGAMSLDGKIAAESGASKWITGEAARQDVHRLRGQYAAIMTGVETVIQDDPALTCRVGSGRNPKRIILDSRLRIPLESKILSNPESNPAIVACTEDASHRMIRRLEEAGTEVLCCRSCGGRIDLTDLTAKLGALQIDSVMLEAGGTVNEAAFSQGIVDKVIFYLAPKIIGGANAKTIVDGVGIRELSDAYPLQIDEIKPLGSDYKITAYRIEQDAAYDSARTNRESVHHPERKEVSCVYRDC